MLNSLRYTLAVFGVSGVSLLGAGPASALGLGSPAVIGTPLGGNTVTVPAGLDSAVSIKATPNARCVLGGKGARGTFTVYADDAGVARFHVKPLGRNANVANVVAQCQGRAGQSVTSLQVRVAAGAPRLVEPQVGRQRQLLFPRGFDPSSASDADLKRIGLPPRPDRVHSAKAYASWLRAMTTPVTRIAAAKILRADVVHGPARLRHGAALQTLQKKTATARKQAPATSNNWSGFVDIGGSGQFSAAFGEWYVPSVYTDANDSPAYSSLWEGIDGDGSGDVIQNGTEQDAQQIWFPFIGDILFTNYYAWYEYYPDNGSTQISNFNVSPSDDIYSESWVCYDGSGNRYGCYWIEDITQGEAVGGLYEQAQQPWLFQGNSAEWVLERPTVGGNLNPLPYYGSAYMTDMYALDTYLGYWNPYAYEANDQISMYNGSDELSTVYYDDVLSSSFYWTGYR